jgi:hypothetical protein
MLIKKAKPHMFDIFIGKGWKFWGRFLVNKDKKLIQIKGNHFNRIEFEEVEMRLCQTQQHH